jgi:hypothetical protein
MVSSGQKLILTEVLRGLPAIKAQAALEDSKATFEFLKDLIAREGLDADLQLVGRFFGAFAPKHLDTLRLNAETLHLKTGVTIRVLSPAEQPEEVGSDYFHGGFVVEELWRHPSGKAQPGSAGGGPQSRRYAAQPCPRDRE